MKPSPFRLYLFPLIASLLITGCSKRVIPTLAEVEDYSKYIEPVSYTHLTLPTTPYV